VIARAALLIATTALIGCSDLAEFERELMGNDARAWALCKEKFGNRVYSAPPYGEHTDEHILFAWNAVDAEREGGPLFCKTNGDGTKLIEMQMSKKASI
jgi:hypothetical protein